MISIASEISLRDIDKENVRDICNLSVRQEQTAYVVSTAIAIAEAAYSVDEWVQSIYADEVPVGLAVIKKNTGDYQYLLWRLMIDSQFQGLKFGSRAIGLLTHQIKADPHCDAIFTSVVAGDSGPQEFYERLGFKLTGETYEGEAVMRLAVCI